MSVIILPNKGHKLPNGATVLDTRITLSGGQPIVLCYWKRNPQPYVVWSIDNEYNTFWGHYFDDKSKAELYFLAK